MLGGARRVSMAELLKESGRKLGYDVEIIAYELDRKVPISLVGKVVKGLRWSDPDVVEDIARIVKENNINIILPFVNGSIEIASLCRDRIPGVFVPVSDFDLCAALFDKVEAAKLFKSAGLHIPRTYNVLNAEIPAIAKPRRGGSSRGIQIFNNIDDLMHLENLDDYLVQEYIRNAREYTVDCYISQAGEILVTVPRERLEIMGGEVTRTQTRHIDELITLTHKVIEKLKFTGCVTIQFLYDPARDRFLLMEVNPRLGGGVICSIYAGAPIPDYILSEALGLPVKPCNDWEDNLLMARYQKEAIFHDNH